MKSRQRQPMVQNMHPEWKRIPKRGGLSRHATKMWKICPMEKQY